ncbi:MAG: restriction endonuclease subunit S [Candidatus Sumerlaeaceae bacterium]|nr:restriction endonuclease subunit S [Candidatus Sumerlaeaceae bacterium]
MISNLKPYPKMKDSGVPWLGQVPEHWALRRMKTLLHERVEKGHPDQPLLAATQTKGVVRKDQYENRTVLALKDLHLLKLVRNGDFVISLRSFQGGIEYARDQGIISPAYTILYPLESQTQRFLARLFKAAPFIENLRLHVTGIREGQNVDYERLSRSSVPIPPTAEQEAIVRFLDHVDRRIRRYIASKQSAAGRAAEARLNLTEAAIDEASTKHVRLSAAADLISRPVKRIGDLVYTPVGLFNRGRGMFHKPPTRGAELGDSEFFWIEEGDLVISGQFAWEGAVALAGQSDAGCIASHRYPVLRGKPAVAESAYLWAFFRTAYGQLLFDVHSRGAAGRNRPLNPRSLLKEHIPIPPLSLQQRIAEMVHLENWLHHAVAQQAALLREFRNRIVADVVTGKIDVRAATAGLPADAGEQADTDESVLENDSGEVAEGSESELVTAEMISRAARK